MQHATVHLLAQAKSLALLPTHTLISWLGRGSAFCTTARRLCTLCMHPHTWSGPACHYSSHVEHLPDPPPAQPHGQVLLLHIRSHLPAMQR